MADPPHPDRPDGQDAPPPQQMPVEQEMQVEIIRFMFGRRFGIIGEDAMRAPNMDRMNLTNYLHDFDDRAAIYEARRRGGREDEAIREELRPPQPFAPPPPPPPPPQQQQFAPPQMPMPVEQAMQVDRRMAPRPTSPTNRRLREEAMRMVLTELRDQRYRQNVHDREAIHRELDRAMDGAAILRVRRQLHRLELEQNEDQRRQAEREERRQAALIAYLRARLDARSDETESS